MPPAYIEPCFLSGGVCTLRATKFAVIGRRSSCSLAGREHRHRLATDLYGVPKVLCGVAVRARAGGRGEVRHGCIHWIAARLSLRHSDLRAAPRVVDQKLENTNLDIGLLLSEHAYSELTFRSRSSNTITLPAPRVSNGVRMCQVRAHQR